MFAMQKYKQMSIQSTIQRFHPSGKFLLLLGLFLLCLGITSVVQVLILLPYSGLQLKDLADEQKLLLLQDFSNPNIIKGMKIAQAVSVLLMFVIPSLLFAYLAHPCPPEDNRRLRTELEFERAISSPSGRWGGAFFYLKMNRGFPAIIGITVMALVFAVMPVINWTGELNNYLSLPEFMSGIEEWMKASEENLKKLTETFLRMEGIGDLMVNIVVVALLAAVGEELFFRGAMQSIILEWTKNVHWAVWISAFVFSFFHFQFYGFLPRMLLGVVLGYLYIWSGSLWLPMLFHFLNNGLAVLFAYLVGKGTISEEAETIGAGETPMYYILVSAVISLGLMYFVYKRNPSPTLPEGKGEIFNG